LSVRRRNPARQRGSAPDRRTRSRHPGGKSRHLVDPRAVRVDCPGRDKRAHERRVIERIANAHRAVRAHQAFDERSRDTPLEDEPARAGTALPSRPDRTENNRPQGKVQIRVVEDDNRVVAPELEDRSPRPLRHRC
jgi:hypothetical protein